MREPDSSKPRWWDYGTRQRDPSKAPSTGTKVPAVKAQPECSASQNGSTTRQPPAKPGSGPDAGRERPLAGSQTVSSSVNGSGETATRGQDAPHADETEFRRRLPPEYQHLSDEELLAAAKKKSCVLTGVRDPELANRIISQVILMRKFGEPYFPGDGSDVEALAAQSEFAPDNIMEAMLAVQMCGAHEASLSFLMAAGRPGLSEKQRDAELRRSDRLMRLFNTQLDRMIKLKHRWARRAKDD